jgi:hypothetical protein
VPVGRLGRGLGAEVTQQRRTSAGRSWRLSGHTMSGGGSSARVVVWRPALIRASGSWAGGQQRRAAIQSMPAVKTIRDHVWSRRLLVTRGKFRAAVQNAMSVGYACYTRRLTNARPLLFALVSLLFIFLVIRSSSHRHNPLGYGSSRTSPELCFAAGSRHKTTPRLHEIGEEVAVALTEGWAVCRRWAGDDRSKQQQVGAWCEAI